MECWIIGFGGLTIKLIGMNLIEIKFMSTGAFIAIVKKTFRLRKVFLLQPLMPPSFFCSERIYDKRYDSHYSIIPPFHYSTVCRVLNTPF